MYRKEGRARARAIPAASFLAPTYGGSFAVPLDALMRFLSSRLIDRSQFVAPRANTTKRTLGALASYL